MIVAAGYPTTWAEFWTMLPPGATFAVVCGVLGMMSGQLWVRWTEGRWPFAGKAAPVIPPPVRGRRSRTTGGPRPNRFGSGGMSPGLQERFRKLSPVRWAWMSFAWSLLFAGIAFPLAKAVAPENPIRWAFLLPAVFYLCVGIGWWLLRQWWRRKLGKD